MAWYFSRRSGKTKNEFLAAGRSLGKWEAAFSIAATWIWAPALFIAAQKAYTHGLAGLFWFTVPNILCLIIFAYFAKIIRNKLPEGFTLSQYIKKRHSTRVQILYLIELCGLATCSFAVQLLAGGAVINSLTGIPFFWVTVVLACMALSYSLLSGLKASVVSDWAQMGVILLTGVTLVPWLISRVGGWDTVIAGLGGKDGRFSSLVSAGGLEVFLSFGIPVSIGLLAGPFGDQSFYQRAFAIKKNSVKQAFLWSALIFGIVPLLMSVFGFAAAGKGIIAQDPQLVNLEMVIRFLPPWVIVPFVYMLLSGLVSTLDSNLCAVSSMAGHDMLEMTKIKKSAQEAGVIRYSRRSMLLLAAAAVGIANIPGMKILYLFLFYGVLRASTLLPTMITLLKEKLSEQGVFYGILASIVVGLPVFAYGNFSGSTSLKVAGSLMTVLISGATTLVVTFIKRRN
ncbi:MAG: hypothetical protein GY765_05740 [bacterium]|nr:hypothetical protein [bacterium]